MQWVEGDEFTEYSQVYANEHNRIVRRQRINAVLMIVPVIMGLIIFITSIFVKIIDLPPGLESLFRILALILFGMSGVSVILTYLQNGFRSVDEQLEDAAGMLDQEVRQRRLIGEGNVEIERIKQELDAGRKQLDEGRKQLDEGRKELKHAVAQIQQIRSVNAQLGEDDKTSLIANLKDQLTSETAMEVISEIQTTIATSLKRDNRDKEIFNRFEESRLRLSRELVALGFRGNLNLAFGAITTLVGLSILGWSVFQEVTSSIKEPWDIASRFIPRLTLVVLIELFAFFFLSLYKASLAEIKYFQNELTNVEAKQIAVKIATEYGDTAMMSSMVNSLASTERNHVLSKDQTTVELEKAKIEREGRGDLVKAVQDLVRSKKD